jgi:hypothetical protein
MPPESRPPDAAPNPGSACRSASARAAVARKNGRPQGHEQLQTMQRMRTFLVTPLVLLARTGWPASAAAERRTRGGSLRYGAAQMRAGHLQSKPTCTAVVCIGFRCARGIA